MIRYHAHIYFGSHNLEVARSLWTQMKKELESSEVKLGPLELGLRGPHLMSQFECDFPETLVDFITAWLRKNRQGLSVLLHPEVEDELKSHLEDALWIGIPIPLDFTKLDLRSRGKDFVPFGKKPKELEV